MKQQEQSQHRRESYTGNGVKRSPKKFTRWRTRMISWKISFSFSMKPISALGERILEIVRTYPIIYMEPLFVICIDGSFVSDYPHTALPNWSSALNTPYLICLRLFVSGYPHPVIPHGSALSPLYVICFFFL